MNDLLNSNPDDLPEVDPNIDYLAEIAGPGKKFDRTRYASEDEWKKAVSKGKYESDQYVELLKRRQDELREDYLRIREDNQTKARLEELIDQLSNKQLASSDLPPAKEDNQPAMSAEQLDNLMSNKIQAYELTKKQTENFNVVQAKLKERYGSNYANVLREQIESLGLTNEDINALAKKSPIAFFKTLGLDQQPHQDSFQSPPRSNQRNDTFAPRGAPKRSWAYYQELKKADPKLYFDRKTAIQMQNDAIELGDAFRDGDYYVKGLHE